MAGGLLLLAGVALLGSQEYFKSKQGNPPPDEGQTGETGGVEETPVEGALVTKATASVSPKTYSSTSCSKTFNFTGKITASREGTVKYYWEKSNGTKSSSKTVKFTKADIKSVSYSWAVNGDYGGWARLKVTSPEALSSSKASFTETCTFAVTKVTSSVSPSINDSCPETYTFTGKIAVNEGGTVKYKWERYFNGASEASSAIKTATFTGAGTKTVTDVSMYNDSGLLSYFPRWLTWLRRLIPRAWAIGSPPPSPTYSGWERIKITSPNAKTSNEADFDFDTSDCVT